MFVDKATIQILAGKGGDGRLNFRSGKGAAKGGPDGGDGGHGGNVVLRASHNTSTLSHYRTNKQHKAEAGLPGGTNNRHGKNGTDIVLDVALGTQVSDGDGVLGDLTHDGETLVVANGGRGGFGNAHFTSSVRQAPRMAELGEPGEGHELVLELKLVADVGLIGLPNAGKSTLLSVISNARPEIANYPFTTLVPNLGVVDWHDASFLAADIPGLIEGAADGKGLGDEFLRHVERTRLLVHLVDSGSETIAADYATIRQELASYKIDLSDKPQVVVLSKIDSLTSAQLKSKSTELAKSAGLKAADVFAISAVAHQGTDKLLGAIVQRIREIIRAEETAAEEVPEEMPIITLESDTSAWEVVRQDEVFVVTGTNLERFAARTNLAQRMAVQRLRDILKRQGVLTEIRRQGGEEGALIRIGRKEFKW